MNEVESVRPVGGNILDLWDKLMETFELEENEDNIEERTIWTRRERTMRRQSV